MGIAVHSLLQLYLEARHLGVDELVRRVESRAGRPLPPEVLRALLSAQPLPTADLELVGIIAQVLDLDLGDLLLMSNDEEGDPGPVAEDALLSDEESSRLSDLLDAQDICGLAAADQSEVTALLRAYHERLHERRVRQIATLRSVPVDQARIEVETALAEKLAAWRQVSADPTWRQGIEEAVARRRREHPVGQARPE